MSSVQIRPFSAVVGAALAGVVLLVLGAAPQYSSVGRRVTVDLMPHPKHHVHILEGAPYVVPNGELLTITTFGHADGLGAPGGQVRLLINGQAVLSMEAMNGVSHLELGITAHPGDTITLEDDDAFSTAVVLGYLTRA